MSLNPDTLPRSALTGDEALAIIDVYRGRVEDHTIVESLDHEFPYVAYELGLTATTLVTACDNLSGAFKWRGALVGATMLAEHGARHLVAPSAGNHARGSVLASKLLGLPITVAVPTTAPEKKRQGIRELWNDSRQLTIREVGTTFNESLDWALRQDLSVLHPFDSREVIAGQGTVVDDILREQPEVQTIVLPVGGGGLLAGVLGRLYELEREDIEVVAAEATGSDSLSRSLTRGELTDAEAPNSRYGGSAVRRIGEIAFEYCQEAPNLTVVNVPEGDVDFISNLYESGRRELLRMDTPNIEPTTLVAVAALSQLSTERRTVVVATGQNDSIYPVPATRRYRVPC